MKTVLLFLEFIYTQLLNTLFPIQCIGCKNKGEYLCAKCLSSIPIKQGIIYNTTSLPALTSGRLCGIMSVQNYSDSPLLKQAIHLFKYRFVQSLSAPLGALMKERITPFFDINRFHEWVVVPVPLHKRKEYERGFNQNDLLVESCFEKHRSTITTLTRKKNPLKRVRYTKTQTKLTSSNRLKNVRMSFKVLDPSSIKNKRILLVDDVMTTGGTLQEAARALSSAGAREIWGFVLAKD